MNVSLLDRHTADAFRHMTFPRFRVLLDFDPVRPTPIAVGAWKEESAVGLALGAMDPVNPAAQLLSLYVEPGHRGNEAQAPASRKPHVRGEGQ